MCVSLYDDSNVNVLKYVYECVAMGADLCGISLLLRLLRKPASLALTETDTLTHILTLILTLYILKHKSSLLQSDGQGDGDGDGSTPINPPFLESLLLFSYDGDDDLGRNDECDCGDGDGVEYVRVPVMYMCAVVEKCVQMGQYEVATQIAIEFKCVCVLWRSFLNSNNFAHTVSCTLTYTRRHMLLTASHEFFHHHHHHLEDDKTSSNSSVDDQHDRHHHNLNMTACSCVCVDDVLLSLPSSVQCEVLYASSVFTSVSVHVLSVLHTLPLHIRGHELHTLLQFCLHSPRTHWRQHSHAHIAFTIAALLRIIIGDGDGDGDGH